MSSEISMQDIQSEDFRLLFDVINPELAHQLAVKTACWLSEHVCVDTYKM